jgi:hypothetical protein
MQNAQARNRGQKLIGSLSAIIDTLKHVNCANKRIKGNITILNHPDLYHKHYYLNEKMSDGVECVAYFDGCNRKKALEKLVNWGLEVWMNNKKAEQIELDNRNDAMHVKRELTVFYKKLSRFAKSHNQDISKII